MSIALETTNLTKRYGRTWALQDCTLSLPSGRVAALVGPNGAGKTTLPRLGFVAQDTPLYMGFTVAELLALGRKLNPRWDDALARARIEKLGSPLARRAGKLSGG